MKRSVLYIEDNEKIGSWVKEELEQRGFSVQWLLSGEGAEQELKQHEVIILDIMLPGLDGFSVGRRLKKAAPKEVSQFVGRPLFSIVRRAV